MFTIKLYRGINMSTALIHQLRNKLPDCFPHLCSHYAEQVAITGKNTTAEDAFSAWSKWLDAEGGVAKGPLTVDASPEFLAFHERSARAIRAVS